MNLRQQDELNYNGFPHSEMMDIWKVPKIKIVQYSAKACWGKQTNAFL